MYGPFQKGSDYPNIDCGVYITLTTMLLIHGKCSLTHPINTLYFLIAALPCSMLHAKHYVSCVAFRTRKKSVIGRFCFNYLIAFACTSCHNTSPNCYFNIVQCALFHHGRVSWNSNWWYIMCPSWIDFDSGSLLFIANLSIQFFNGLTKITWVKSSSCLYSRFWDSFQKS